MSNKAEEIPEDDSNLNNDSFVMAKIDSLHVGNITTFGLPQEDAIAFYHIIKHVHHKQPTRYILYLPEDEL